MAKLTQTEVKAKADEWAELEAKIAKAEIAKGKELDPFIDKFNEETKAIVDKHESKIAKLEEKRNELAADILGWLKGRKKPVTITGEKAIAAWTSKPGSRVINVQKFFAAVKDHNTSFWDCVTVAIKKAEELIGKKEVDAICTKPAKDEASLVLKD